MTLNKGCGKPTTVIGTNGGTMPCGAVLSGLGQPVGGAVQLCGKCASATDREDEAVAASRGTRPFRVTTLHTKGYSTPYAHTHAHSRLDLAMKSVWQGHSIVWHVSACPLRDPQKGKVR